MPLTAAFLTELVAPFTGAWIEIVNSEFDITDQENVAPFTGAWIEISWKVPADVEKLSHPSRVRGLKLDDKAGVYVLVVSHPSRVRGLKLVLQVLSASFAQVAPFTGAWIEINPRST